MKNPLPLRKAIVLVLACALLLTTGPLTELHGAQSREGLLQNSTGKPAATDTKPQTLSDLTAQHSSEGSNIFLADSATGAIYTYAKLKNDPLNIPFSSFKLFFKNRDFPAPAALAYREGKLVVYDKAALALFEIDVETRQATTILDRPMAKSLLEGQAYVAFITAFALSEPVSLAASDDGEIAVSGAGSDTVIRFKPSAGRLQIEGPNAATRQPKRLVYYHHRLLVLNSSGNIHSLAPVSEVGGGQPPATPQSEQESAPAAGRENVVKAVPRKNVFRDQFSAVESGSSLFKLPSGISSRIAKIEDFAINGDSFYLAGQDRLITYVQPPKPPTEQVEDKRGAAVDFAPRLLKAGWQQSTRLLSRAPTEAEVYPIVFDSSGNTKLYRLFVTHDRIYVGDLNKHGVMSLKLSRAVVKLERSVEESNKALVSLYQHLWEQKTLPIRVQKVTKGGDGKTIEDLLVGENVILSKLTEGGTPESKLAQSERSQLALVICNINSVVNGWSCVQTPDMANQVLSSKVSEGQAVAVPDLNVDSYKMTSIKHVNGISVGQYLSQFLTDEQSTGLSTEYLMRINPSFARTFEYEMTRLGYIAARPTASELKPGAVIKISNQQESVVQASAGCQVKAVPWESDALPGKIRTRALDEFLPRLPGQTPNMTELSKLEVEALEVQFIIPKQEALDTGSAEGACLRPTPEADTYLISAALRVAKGRYRLLNKDGSVVKLSEADLARLGIWGQPDPDPDWTFHVGTPYYIGYRVHRPDDPSGTSPLSDLHRIKPGGRQDIYSQLTNDLILPVVKWQFSLLTNAEEGGEDSPIIKHIVSLFPNVRVTPIGPGEPVIASPDYSRPAPVPDSATLEQIKKRYKDVLELIDFPQLTDLDMSGVYVGVLERGGSVDQSHPDFIRDKLDPGEVETEAANLNPGGEALDVYTTAWLKFGKPDDTDQWPRLRVMNPVLAPVKKAINFDRDNTHGTHVAGILSAKGGDISGLIPDANLILVDVNAKKYGLEELIQGAFGQGTIVFNVSREIEFSSPSSIASNLRDAWRSALFVVAAGNDGIDLNGKNPLDVKSPLRYLPEVPNMLSVGATCDDKKILPPSGAGKSDGSNRGQQYVQLLAPGCSIYSSSEEKDKDGKVTGYGYSRASGTSQAAPFVAATAVLLQGLELFNGLDVGARIKARLIYTADWSPDYEGVVWGGFLNANRATWEPRKNLFWTSETDVKSINVNRPEEATITIANFGQGTPTGAYIDEPTHPGVKTFKSAKRAIPFNRILRLQKYDGSHYRVVYVENDNSVRILMNAELKGSLEYKTWEEYDPNAKKFVKMESAEKMSLPINSITNFIAGISHLPKNVQITF
jgi:subtilisin family serine protease